MATQTTSRVAAPRGVSKGSDAGKEPAAAAPEKKKSKKKLIMIVALVVVVGAGAYFMLGKKSAKPGPPKPGAVVAMTDTTLNLADGHFLKIKLALQTVVGAPADLDTSKAADLMITEFSNQTVATLTSETGRDHLKQDLLTKIEAAYPKQIMGLYFTDFVMQ